ncbi:MAG: transposase [Paracoccaceae bacterium]
MAVEALQAQVDDFREANARLEHLVRELNQALYGKKSEKLSENERQLCFEDPEVAVAESEEQQPRLKQDVPGKKATAPKRNLGNLSKGLPRIETVIEPDSILCPCGCGEMVRIGEDRTERLDIVPAQLRVLVTVRPKYACPACKGGVTQAKSPAHLIEGALPTEGAIAHVPPLGDAGIACRATGLQIRGSSASLSAKPDLQALGPRFTPAHAGRMGWQSIFPSDAGGGSNGCNSEDLNKTLYALSADYCAIACRVTDETTAPVLGWRGATGGNIFLCRRAWWNTCRGVPRRL